MAGQPRDVTEEIRRRVGILEVVSAHVTLKRAGRSYKGLCPFHSEKTPSFTVDPERGFFYCFGCHAGGDVFDFVMRMGGVPFGEALQELADRTGVRLERTPAGDQHAGERERLLRAVAEAAAFFRAALAGDAGARARAYLASRGVTPAITDAFGIGYAPAGWDSLLRALRARGFDAAMLEQAGLATARTGSAGHYDALRDRVIFPIRDLQARPIAFGGRALDDAMPKYLNSRETPLFAKGKTLYGLDAARAAIRDTGEAVVVEGYLDAVACHQFDVRNAVASLGTALTLDQVSLLKRFASRAILVYDADSAGADATERGLGVFEAGLPPRVAAEPAQSAFTLPMNLFDQAELPVRVAVLPGGADPDSFLRTSGPEAFQRLLAAALPVFEFRLAIALTRHDPQTVEGKVGIVDEMSQLLTMVRHPVRQGEYVRVLAERLGVREDAIQGQLRRVGGRAHGRARPAVVTSAPVSDSMGRVGAERLLLHLLVADTGVRDALRETIEPGLFREAAHRELAEAVLAPGAEFDDPGRLRARLRDETAVSLLSRFLVAVPPVKADPRRVADGCVLQIRRWALRERIGRLRDAHEAADRAHDDARREAVSAELEEAYREKERIGS